MGDQTTEAVARWNEIDEEWQQVALSHEDYSFYESFDEILKLHESGVFFFDEELAWIINDLCDLAGHAKAEAKYD